MKKKRNIKIKNGEKLIQKFREKSSKRTYNKGSKQNFISIKGH